jgi:class 3 adenylate cyclase
MRELPSGTVTFLFTDIEGSTRLLHELGDDYAEALAEHRRALRAAFERHGGVEVDTQGDAFFVAFARASDALAAAGEGQGALGSGPIRVRMGVHTGEPLLTEEGYVGIDVHRAARIAAVGHGVALAARATLAPQVPELEHPLALGGQEAGQAGAERAAPLDRERPAPRRLLPRELQGARVAAAARGHARLEDDPAGSSLDDRERVPVAVRVDPDHVVQLICKHPRHLQPRLGEQLRCRSGGEDRGRQNCDGSRPTRADRLLIRPASGRQAGTGLSVRTDHWQDTVAGVIRK